MKFLNKMEHKYGRYAIRNLPLIMIIFLVAGYTLRMLYPELLNYLAFSPELICRGQVWRLISWVLMPPTSLDIFTVIMLFFYYWIARTLAAAWGDFMFNIYMIGGVAITDVGMLIAYVILKSQNTAMARLNIMVMPQTVTTYYILTSILLAFALTYPDMQVLLYFLIPVKMSWMGILYGVFLVYDFYKASMAVPRLMMLLSVANFAVYYLATRNLRRISPAEILRRTKYRSAVNRQKGGQFSVFGKDRGEAPAKAGAGAAGKTKPSFTKIYPDGARHRCTVCGRTERDDPNLEFRFCSRCEGNYEYCQDHLFTHQHIKNGVPQGEKLVEESTAADENPADRN